MMKRANTVEMTKDKDTLTKSTWGFAREKGDKTRSREILSLNKPIERKEALKNTSKSSSKPREIIDNNISTVEKNTRIFPTLQPAGFSIYRPNAYMPCSLQISEQQRKLPYTKLEQSRKLLDNIGTKIPNTKQLRLIAGLEDKTYCLDFISHKGAKNNTNFFAKFLQTLKVRFTDLLVEERKYTIELLTHYLQIKPEYFNENLSKDWAFIANHLKSLNAMGANTKAAMEAIANMTIIADSKPYMGTSGLLVNGLSKHADLERCQQAAEKMGYYILHSELSTLKEERISTLANGFSKWPQSDQCGTAVSHIAQEIFYRNIINYKSISVANLINAFSKWPEKYYCKQVIDKFSKHILLAENHYILSVFKPVEISSIINGLSKLDTDIPRKTLLKLTEVFLVLGNNRLLFDFKLDVLTTVVNGFSKWPGYRETQTACSKLAEHIVECRNLLEINKEELAILANGIAKFTDKHSEALIIQIAKEITDSQNSTWSQQSNIMYREAFLKWPNNKDCKLAHHIISSRL